MNNNNNSRSIYNMNVSIHSNQLKSLKISLFKLSTSSSSYRLELIDEFEDLLTADEGDKGLSFPLLNLLDRRTFLKAIL